MTTTYLLHRGTDRVVVLGEDVDDYHILTTQSRGTDCVVVLGEDVDDHHILTTQRY